MRFIYMTLKMSTAQVVETSVTVNNNSPIQAYVHPDDQTQPSFKIIILPMALHLASLWNRGLEQLAKWRIVVLLSSANLNRGKFHHHLRDVFAPLVIRYIDLMESSIAQSLHKEFQRENWNPVRWVNLVAVNNWDLKIRRQQRQLER